MNRTFFRPALSGLCLLLVGVFCFTANLAHGAAFVTIQPNGPLGSETGYIVTFSWEDGFGFAPAGPNNGGALDDKTTLANGNYGIPAGINAGLNIGYGHNNQNGVVNDNHVNGAGFSGHVDWTGVGTELLAAGTPGQESTLEQFGAGDFINNVFDSGALRIFGSGVQGVTSLSSHNGISPATNIYGAMLGQPVAIGLNGNGNGGASNDFLRLILFGEKAIFPVDGLAILELPHVSGASPTKFDDMFFPGTYLTSSPTSGTHPNGVFAYPAVNPVELFVTTDPNYVPKVFGAIEETLVPEPASFSLCTISLLSLGFVGWRRRRR